MRTLTRTLAVIAAASACWLGHATPTTQAPTPLRHNVSPAEVIGVPAVAPTPVPTSAADYQRMWSGLDPAEWGGADVSLSVPLRDGRAVWLYGDTLSVGRFVHSSAITQTGGDLHVSHTGSQLLPDDPDGTIYWIESGIEASPGTLHIAAMPMRVGTGGLWDFERVNPQSRVAEAVVDLAGDVTFTRWIGWTDPAPAYNDLDHGPSGIEGHLVYENRAHPEAVMSSSLTLWTVNQNWDIGDFKRTNSGAIDFAAYQPIFYER